MFRTMPYAIVATLAFASPGHATAQQASSNELVRQLLQGCLNVPSRANVADVATQIGAEPYSEVKIRDQLADHSDVTISDGAEGPDQALRTKMSVNTFNGWDLPNHSGEIDYTETDYSQSRVNTKTRQILTPWRNWHTRSCDFDTKVSSARQIFEIYQSIQSAKYGIFVADNRRVISIFIYDPNHHDIELHFQFASPLVGLVGDASDRDISRLILTDGGPRFLGQPVPAGVSTVTSTRAALLSGLDRPAEMSFVNSLVDNTKP